MGKIEKIRISLIIFLVLTSFVFLLEARTASSANENLTINATGIEQYVDPTILEAFNNLSEVPVIVKVVDTSGISISARVTKEQQFIDILRKKEFLENNTETILLTLPITEFRLKKKLQSGRGFSGNITAKGLGHLINNSDIKSIYLNEPLHVVLDESSPIINADDVESAGYTGKYQSVCILDTGIDYDLNGLGGCLGSGCKVRSGWNYVVSEGHPDEDDPDDDQGHGTHVAGIAASEDGTYRGIAPDADLVAVKVCDSSGDCLPDDISDGLFFCYFSRNLYNISVVSISIGDNGEYSEDCSTPNWAEDEINDLYNVGIPVIVASGNNGHRNGISYPACAPNVTSVGATDKNDNFAPYTNRDNSPLSPDLLAPGGIWGDPEDTAPFDEIVSLYSQDVATDSDLCFLRGFPWIGGSICNDPLANLSGSQLIRSVGTSMAAPHVSGAAALLLEVNGSLTPDEIESTLEDTGVTVGSYKRIDVLAAINSLRDKDSDGYYDEGYGGNDCNDKDGSVHPGAAEICDDIDNDCDDVVDEGCTSDCTVSGYEQCFESSYEDCTTGIAINRYENVNTIQWGAVNDSYDPYVISQYRIGWKGLGSEKAYYGQLVNETCEYGGCDSNKEVATQGTKVTVNAPGTAHHYETLSYNDTPSYWCTTWFYEFQPNYGSDNLVYVLNCFDDNDCAANEFCDKSGSWSSWDCAAKYSDGQSCTSDSVCQSNYCDNDGVGLSDDSWCFTPYNTYFDGQETGYCEYSSGNGIADCDERQVGDDLNKCVGDSYYEEECSSTCGYTDITSVFECGETSCSCSTPQCDGVAPQGTINYCDKGGQTYFQDDCGSTATAEDTGSVCRSANSLQSGDGCTADVQCNGVTAGTDTATGSCSATCAFDAFPNVTLVSPLDNNVSSSGNVVFNCSASDDKSLINITLYHNITGTWQVNETKTLGGTQDSETFTISNISDNTNFIWNCLAYDNASQAGWADTNYSVTVNIPAANITISSLSAISISETHKIFETVILNNGDTLLEDVLWSLDLGDGTVINSTYNTSLVADETVFLFVEYNYSVEGEYTVRVNATAVSDNLSALKDLEVGASALSVVSLAEIYSNVSEKVFEFIINNTGENNITVNWSLDFGDGNVVSSESDANLTSGEDVFVFAQHNYLNHGDYTVVATAQADSSTDSASIVSEVRYIEITNLSVINISETKRTFEFIVVNRMSTANLSDVAWSLDTGNSFKFNSIMNVTLVPSEDLFVFVEYDYGTTGDFVVNTSAWNSTLLDYQLLNVTVT